MAGDWIKMRGNLWDDPRVARLCDSTDQGEATIIGGLYWLWATADQHTEDGIMPGLSPRQIDRKTGIQGFAAALVAIGWLAEHPEGVRIVNFDEHNGASAKKRCQTAKRVAAFKAGNAEVTQDGEQGNAQSVTNSLAVRDLEKEKEKEKNTSSLRSEVESAPPQRGSRLPADWQLPDDWATWAKQARPDLSPAETAQRFADYWHAVPGAKGRKADWLATWRNWVRNEKAQPVRVQQPESFRERDERLARERIAAFAPSAAAKPRPIDSGTVIDAEPVFRRLEA